MLPGWSVPRGLRSVVLGPGHIAPAVVPRVGRRGAYGGGPGQALVATAVVAWVGTVVRVDCLGPTSETNPFGHAPILLIPWADKVRFPEAIACGIEGWIGCGRLSCDWTQCCCCLPVPQGRDIGQAAPGLLLSWVSVQPVAVIFPLLNKLRRFPGQATGPHWGGPHAWRGGGSSFWGRDGAGEIEIVHNNIEISRWSL